MNQSVNVVHDEALIELFRNAIGKRVLLLMPSFPFLFIGKLENVVDDLAILQVETTSVPALEHKEWQIHIHSIEVFYIENEGGSKIPKLN